MLRVTPAVAGHRRDPGHLRLGGARAADGLAGAAGHHDRRLPGQPRAARTWAPPPAWPSPSPSARCCCSSASSPPRPAPASGGRFATRRAGAGSRAPSTWASTGCATTPAPPPTCWSAGFAYQLTLVLAAVAAAQALGLRPAGLTALLAFFPAVAHRPGAAHLHGGPRRARRGVRAVPRTARRGAGRMPSPSGCCSTCSTCSSACWGRRPSPPAAGCAGGGAIRRRHSPAADAAPATAAGGRPGDGVTAPATSPRPAGSAAVVARGRSTSSSSTWATRRCGTSSARAPAPRSTPTRRSTTARPSSSSSGTCGLYFEDRRCSSWYLDLPGDGLIRFWNVYYGIFHFLVTGIALVWCTGPPRGATGCGATRWRHHAAGAGRVRLVLADAAPAAGRPGHLRRLPRLRRRRLPRPDEAGDPPCDEFGYVDTMAVYGGWASFGSDEMAAVSNQYAAMPSMHIGWSTWCAFVLVPLVRRRWLKVLVVGLPALHAVLHHRDRQPLLDRRARRPGVPGRRATGWPAGLTGLWERRYHPEVEREAGPVTADRPPVHRAALVLGGGRARPRRPRATASGAGRPPRPPAPSAARRSAPRASRRHARRGAARPAAGHGTPAPRTATRSSGRRRWPGPGAGSARRRSSPRRPASAGSTVAGTRAATARAASSGLWRSSWSGHT